MKCPYTISEGKKPFGCSLLKERCPFQRWCTTDRIFKLTNSAQVCTVRVKNEQKGQR